MSSVLTMDVNYSRWMSKDPDEPEVIEDEPRRRFTLPRPRGSVVASGTLVALVVLGGAAFVRSTATTDASADDPTQTVQTQTADDDSGPGAASVDESTADEDSTSDDSTSVYSTSDDSGDSDDSTSEDSDDSDDSDDTTAEDDSVPPGPRLMLRREFDRSDGMSPGELRRERQLQRWMYGNDDPAEVRDRARSASLHGRH